MRDNFQLSNNIHQGHKSIIHHTRIHDSHPDPILECILSIIVSQCHTSPARCSFPDSEAFSEHVLDGDGLTDHSLCVQITNKTRHLLISPCCPSHNNFVSCNRIFFYNIVVRKVVNFVLWHC